MESWPPREIERHERSLDELVTMLQDKRSGDEYLSRYLTVRACGFLEQCIRLLSRAHVEGRSGGTVRSFALTHLERMNNPSPGTIAGLLGRFDASLPDEFALFLDKDGGVTRQELEGLVQKRNLIAHGENEGVRPTTALKHAEMVRNVVDELARLLHPERTRQTNRAS